MDSAPKGAEPARLRSPRKLPAIRGKWLVAYRVIWIVAMLLALSSATFLRLGLERQREATSVAIYGAGLMADNSDATGLYISPFSAEAKAKGIQKGDRLIAVEGHPASLADSPPRLAGPDGSAVHVLVKHADGRVAPITLTRSSSYLRDGYAGTGLTWRLRRHIEFGFEILGDLLGLAVAAILFLRRPSDPVSALLSFGVVLSATNPVTFGFSSPILPTITGTTAAGIALAGVLFFPDGQLTPRWWWLPGVTILITLFLGVSATQGGVPPILPGLFMLSTLILTVAAVVQRYRKSEPGTAQQQMKFAVLGFIGTLVFISIGFVAQQVRPLIPSGGVYLILLSNLGLSLGSVAFAAGLLIALLRYRLYDADALLGRSAAYGVLTLGFVGLFAGAEKMAELIGERYFEHSIGIAAGAIGAAIASACVVPLHNRVHRWAERRFQKPLLRLREGLPTCLEDLRDAAPVAEIANAAMKRIHLGTRATRQAMLWRQGNDWEVARSSVDEDSVRTWLTSWQEPTGESLLQSDRRDPLFPMRLRLSIDVADESETVGWLLLGPRPDGSLFGKDEREALIAVAGPVARAVHIAQRREAREASIEARFRDLEALVAKGRPRSVQRRA